MEHLGLCLQSAKNQYVCVYFTGKNRIRNIHTSLYTSLAEQWQYKLESLLNTSANTLTHEGI